MNKTLITLITGGIVLTIGLITIFGLIGTYNGAASLKNTYDMKIKANEAEYDLLWKSIKQAAEIPEQKKQAFKEIFESYAGSRNNGSSNQMMTWVKETVPNIDLKVYDNLMNIITGSRDRWTTKQTELVSIAEQYNYRLTVFPGNVILPMMGFNKIEPKVITSSRTQDAFMTGQDNDTDVFNKK